MDKCVCLLTAFSERMRRVPVALPEMVRALSAHQQTLKQVCVCVGVVRTLVLGTLGGRGLWSCSGGWGRRVGLLELYPRAQVWECVCRCLHGDIHRTRSTQRRYLSAHVSGEPGLWHGPLLGLLARGGGAGARYRSLWLAKCFSVGLCVCVVGSARVCAGVCLSVCRSLFALLLRVHI